MENKGVDTNKKFQENFHKAKYVKNQFCPVRDIISRISDKWSHLVILALGGFGTLRFNELKHKIGDVSQRMLTVTLRNLEADGLIIRTIYPEVPPRVEYQLTPLGFDLMEQLTGLAEWAEANSEAILNNRNKLMK
jgi:DNA-binding HxlR family transcriptional regulator